MTFGPGGEDRGGRGQVQLVDLSIGVLMLVALMVLAPFLFKLVSVGVGGAEGFTALLLRLALPLLFIAVIVSVGVSGG